MQIVAIDTYRLQVPLRTPFKTALRTVDVVDDLVVRVVLENGLQGFGEAAPTLVITGDSLQSMHAVIHQVYKPLLLGRSLLDFNDVLRVVQQAVVGNRSAKAALEIALFDARARALGLPLYQLLGGGQRELQTDITISLNPVAQMVEDAKQAVGQVFEVVQSLAQIGILGGGEAGAVLGAGAVDGGLGGQAAAHRLLQRADPSPVVGEHPVGLEHLDGGA